jgi:DNA-binding Lrp family transcriptional regulator
MATRNRDDRGQFSPKISDQDILKAFDFEARADDPFLTVSEVADALASHFGIDVSDEAVRVRLQAMLDAGDVDRREFGPGVAYRALVGPELADDVATRSDERRETPRDEFVEL